MRIETPRFVLRDFTEADRQPFVDYQLDPRYRRLYDLPEGDPAGANRLFDMFGEWRRRDPRDNFQVGIFDRADSGLCGCAGLRRSGQPKWTAEFGIELAPDSWGRFAMAVECCAALLEWGFSSLDLDTIIGATASFNRRVEALARWFGATIVDHRDGASWMKTRGGHEVAWRLSRVAWTASPARRRLLARA